MDASRYAELFRTESIEQLAELDRALLSLERDGDLAQVDVALRHAHTIKGMAGAMRYQLVERMAHALESVLTGMRQLRTTDASTVDLALEGSGALRRAVVAAVDLSDAHDSAAIEHVLRRLADWHQGGGALTDERLASVALVSAGIGGGPLLFASVAPSAEQALVATSSSSGDAVPRAEGRELHVTIRLHDACPLKGVRAFLIVRQLASVGDVREVRPTHDEMLTSAFDGNFIVGLSSSRDVADVEACVQAAGDVHTVTCVSALPVRRRATDALRTVRIDLARLDSLLDSVSELVIARDKLLRIVDATTDHAVHRALSRAAQDTARLINAMQQQVLHARMVPVGQVFDRFPRFVRDTARELGKDVMFEVEGRDIELDRSLLDAIGEPIVHLLRNALDHGIEHALARQTSGKPPTGRLVLRARRDRASVVIEVEDDGRGIDRVAILARARADGFVSADTTQLDDPTLLAILAHSGFSTATEVTSISGRGVGVDVVATRVRALAGTLTLRTVEAAGTVFSLRLPATLAVMRVLLVQVGDGTYAIPAANVVEALEYDPGAIRPGTDADAGEWLRVRDRWLRVVRPPWRSLGDQPPNAGAGEEFVVVVEAADAFRAVLVDALIGQRDVVVKPFDAPREGVRWFNGAAVLGDGRPTLIVDLGNLR